MGVKISIGLDKAEFKPFQPVEIPVSITTDGQLPPTLCHLSANLVLPPPHWTTRVADYTFAWPAGASSLDVKLVATAPEIDAVYESGSLDVILQCPGYVVARARIPAVYSK